MSNINPYPHTFCTFEGKNLHLGILAWQNIPGSNNDNITDGYIQVTEANYFTPKEGQTDENGNIIYDRSFKISCEDFFGKADIGDVGNSVFSESIKGLLHIVIILLMIWRIREWIVQT